MMLNRLVFAALYLRNLHGFGGSHRYAIAATRLDMALRQHRKRHQRRRGAP